MRLRRKLTIAFFLVSSLVSVLLALFLYRFIEGQLTAEVKDRVKDITYIGAHSVDVARYRRLTSQLGELNENAVAQIEHSDDYKEIFGQLQMMRKAESSIIVAGVIGRKKFIYDLWGDTVNTASRMESHGLPGRIHVTEATYQALQYIFDFEPRDLIDVKGKGQMKTYLLLGQRARESMRT